jgi:hydrogenase maturation protease
VKVIGVGNRWRSDDGVGLFVARQLRGRLPDGVELLEREGEPSALIDAIDDPQGVWLIDAVSSGAEPGTIHRIDASETALPAELFRGSTHHLGLPEAVELARALDRLPPRLVVFGIEGARFEVGDEISGVVASAAERVAQAVGDEVAACMSRR